MFNNQVYQFWGVIWAITAVAGAVLLRQRWRWLLSVNLLGFCVCDLCAHVLTSWSIKLPLRNCLRDRSHSRTTKRRIDRDWF